MSEPFLPNDSSLSLDAHRRVDEIGQRFHDAWVAGARPRIEDFLPPGCEPTIHRALLHDLLLEATNRRERRRPDLCRGPALRTLGLRQVVAGASRSAATPGEARPSGLCRGRSRADGSSSASRTEETVPRPGRPSRSDRDVSGSPSRSGTSSGTAGAGDSRPVRAVVACPTRGGEHRTGAGPSSVRRRTGAGAGL